MFTHVNMYTVQALVRYLKQIGLAARTKDCYPQGGGEKNLQIAHIVKGSLTRFLTVKIMYARVIIVSLDVHAQ